MLMPPLPHVNKVYSLLIQQEREKLSNLLRMTNFSLIFPNHIKMFVLLKRDRRINLITNLKVSKFVPTVIGPDTLLKCASKSLVFLLI